MYEFQNFANSTSDIRSTKINRRVTLDNEGALPESDILSTMNICFKDNPNFSGSRIEISNS